MSEWKENKLVGIVTGVILLIAIIFILTQITGRIQQKRRQIQEFEKWKGAPQSGKVPR